MRLDPLTRNAARLFLAEVAKEFPLTGAKLFGSRARRTHDAASDADVAVFLAGEPGSFSRTKLLLADIAFDVLLETGILVQPLPVWEVQRRSPETFVNPQLLANIESEGITL